MDSRSSFAPVVARRAINLEDEVIKETAKTYVYPARLDIEQRKFISIGHGRTARARSPDFPTAQFVPCRVVLKFLEHFFETKFSWKS